ncbi:MAG: amino-acid N-acetyltransferase [Pseudomonadota bacterium]
METPSGESAPSLPGFVEAFRHSAPYINAFRGRTFVVCFGGEAVAGAGFPALIHDLALLHSLGVRLVLVHGARPQIEARLAERGVEPTYHDGLRVTPPDALECVIEAAGRVRTEVEARLSTGLANSPMAGMAIRVVSGNFVTARPAGIRDGVDLRHTGEVRRIAADALAASLDAGAMALLGPLGYSPTGEVFNLFAEEVAARTAVALEADKLIFLGEGTTGAEARELTVEEAAAAAEATDGEARRTLAAAASACRAGVHRVHLLDRQRDGILVEELFTRDGVGTLVSRERFEGVRPATIDDVGGILELIAPLEADGTLVRRDREQLETTIDDFVVVERDGAIIGSAALHAFPGDGIGEIACLAVDPAYRAQGRGDGLLDYLLRRARSQGLRRLVVLTTRTGHWFRERGFEPADLEALPMDRRALYNFQRGSRVLARELAPDAAGERP